MLLAKLTKFVIQGYISVEWDEAADIVTGFKDCDGTGFSETAALISEITRRHTP
jgi:hypothetical protein